MLIPRDNELLVRTGHATQMGNLLRSYWMPLLLSSDLPECDGRPMRVKLLGEDLVAFRDTSGTVGLVSERCPHRGASLAFGRNEECGLRCVYHGWKFNAKGECVDIPTEPVDRGLSRRVKITAYPTFERNGMIWTFMGGGAQPQHPKIEWGLVPESHRYVSRRVMDCNWAQALEGDIDTSHASFLHGRLNPTDYDQFERAQAMKYMDRDGHPVFEVKETDYGLMIAARRNAEEDSYYWRITQFLFPFFTMPAPYEDIPYRSNVWQPMDDHRTLVWTIDWHPNRPLTDEEIKRRDEGLIGHCTEFLPETSEASGRWYPLTNRSNEYRSDFLRQKTEQYSGIREVWAQDKAVSESMGSIADRSKEHLGSSDAAIVRWRRRMLASVHGLNERGEAAPGIDPDKQLVRSASFVLPRDQRWQDVIEEQIRGGLGVPTPANSI